MFRIISEPNSKTVAVKISAEVSKEDYELALPRLEDKIKTEGKINLYCEMDNVSSITPGAVWQDLKFDIKHLNDFQKVAIVGEKEWEKWLTKIGSYLTSAQVRYYPSDKKADAMQWVTQ